MIFITNPHLRRFYALAWSILVTILLVQSSSQPLVGPATAPDDINPMRELLFNSAHLIAFSVMVFLWWWALRENTPHIRAILIALVIALLLGTITEFMQHLVPDRELSLLDLTMNWGAAVAMAYYLRYPLTPKP